FSLSSFFFFTTRCPPVSSFFPYTTLFRSTSPKRQRGKRGEDSLAGASGLCTASLARRACVLPRWRVGLTYPDPSHLPGFSSRAKDRKSTRLNSSHGSISYAVFCLKKKKHN